MKPATQIRLATRLFPHLEEMIGLKKLEPEEVVLLYNALTLWIRVQQTRTAAAEHETTDTPIWLTSTAQRTYRLQDRWAAQTRLKVSEESQSPRFLPHVPIFCPWGFGTDSLAARDTALAILADYFGEPLSRRTFTQGQGHACQYYPALVTYLHTRARHGIIETREVTALLLHCQKVPQAAWEQGEMVLYPRPNGS